MTVNVVNNPDKSRYEVFSDDALAGFAEYEIRPDTPEIIAFVHTETDPAFAGQGLAGQLANVALSDVQARGMSVLPFCAYINGYIKKHPEFLPLVPEQVREKFDLPA